MSLDLENRADLERFIRDHLRRPEVRRELRSGPAWLTGSGAPAGALGDDGDFYLDTATKTAYVKQSGVWV